MERGGRGKERGEGGERRGEEGSGGKWRGVEGGGGENYRGKENEKEKYVREKAVTLLNNSLGVLHAPL